MIRYSIAQAVETVERGREAENENARDTKITSETKGTSEPVLVKVRPYARKVLRSIKAAQEAENLSASTKLNIFPP